MPYQLYMITLNPKLSIKANRHIYTEAYCATTNLMFF